SCIDWHVTIVQMTIMTLVYVSRPKSSVLPYTTLFRSGRATDRQQRRARWSARPSAPGRSPSATARTRRWPAAGSSRGSCRASRRSEEHTSELQSRENLVCRLLLEKKKHGLGIQICGLV